MSVALEYDVRLDCLSGSLAERFTPTRRDQELERFVEQTEALRAGPLKTLAFRGLRRFMSDYDAYGTLRMYRMHLLGSAQWRSLLGRDTDAHAAPRGSLLDVGAGDGGVTSFARPLFERVCVTESSRALTRVLRHKGFEVIDHDLGTRPWPTPERFDVISLLNVLDRTQRPLSLLRNARLALRDAGTLLVSVPLPLRPHVYVGPDTADPDEPLPELRDDFEAGVSDLVDKLLTPHALTVQRFSRVPYLSHGDKQQAMYVLDAAVLACRAS
jgi:SAM-dependent methyltransferase